MSGTSNNPTNTTSPTLPTTVETVTMSPLNGMKAIFTTLITLNLAANGSYGPIFYQLGNKIPLSNNNTASLSQLIRIIWSINNPDIVIQQSDIDSLISALQAGVQQL